MFTGIVKGIGKVEEAQEFIGLTKLKLKLPDDLTKNLEIGASVSINGVCLTVVKIDSDHVHFDVIEETLAITNLKGLRINQNINVERSLKVGDEIGGHILSGHIFGTAVLQKIEKTENNCVLSLKTDPKIIKYLFKKGYVALNGVSLTLVFVDKETNIFTVHLIPETLRATTFSESQIGDLINVEIDYQTQIILDSMR